MPLGEERYRIQLTASRTLHEQLKQAQELLRHRIPNGDVAAVVELALERLVRELKKERFGQTDQRRKLRRHCRSLHSFRKLIKFDPSGRRPG